MDAGRLRVCFSGALGDVVAMTASIRDLALYNPHMRIEVSVSIPAVFENNVHVCNWPSKSPVHEVYITEADYRAAVAESSRGLRRHFIEFFHDILRRRTGLPCQLTVPRPDLHLTPNEQRVSPVPGSYWVLFAGGKSDILLKHWEYARYQSLVYELAAAGISVVQTGRRCDMHPPLLNAVNMVGQGGVRELFQLIYHSRGVICPITSGMHIAAAFEKPCVVLAGGREEPWWESYNSTESEDGGLGLPVAVPHRFLHTFRKLECCQSQGCWLKTLASCKLPVNTTSGQPIPACLDAITVSDVVSAVLSYAKNAGDVTKVGEI